MLAPLSLKEISTNLPNIQGKCLRWGLQRYHPVFLFLRLHGTGDHAKAWALGDYHYGPSPPRGGGHASFTISFTLRGGSPPATAGRIGVVKAPWTKTRPPLRSKGPERQLGRPRKRDTACPFPEVVLQRGLMAARGCRHRGTVDKERTQAKNGSTPGVKDPQAGTTRTSPIAMCSLLRTIPRILERGAEGCTAPSGQALDDHGLSRPSYLQNLASPGGGADHRKKERGRKPGADNKRGNAAYLG